MKPSSTQLQAIITESIMSALTERADVVAYNGGKLLTNAMSGAYPFFYDKTSGKVTVGDEKEKHYDAIERQAFVMPDEDEGVEDVDFDKVIMGRYWREQNVMGFWGVQPSADIVRTVAGSLQEQGYLHDVNDLQIVVDSQGKHREGWALLDHYLVPYANYIQGNLESTYKDSEEFKQQYALHLADMKTKRERVSGYLNSRSQSLGKKLRTKDGEMTQAEWNALHRTSESKSYRRRFI